MTLRDPESCPKCHSESRVVDSRPTPTHRVRYRQCVACHGRWRTFESFINPAKVTLKPVQHAS